jgi:transcription antitermination factor NusG
MESTGSWHVIRTARFKESYVHHQLQETVGVEGYLPMVKIPKTCLRPGQAQIEPLFRGYVFGRLDVATHLLPLRRIQAFHSLVCFDGAPALVDDSVINELRRRERGRGYVNLPAVHEPLRADGNVKVVEGPFTGYAGLFVRYLDDTERVCILLDILRTGVRLELPARAVAAVAGKSGAGY